MKKILFIAALLLVPFGFTSAATDYYLKIDGVEGESSAAASTQTAQPTRVAPDSGEEAQADYYLKIDGVEGEALESTGVEPDEIDVAADGSTEKKKGNVEYGWKVEEGEKLESTGVEPDEIDVAADGEPITPDFGILLGGGESDDSEATEQSRAEIEKILLQGMQEESDTIPTESISFNFDKITTRTTQEVKLFGLLPVPAPATVEIDAEENVKVKFPWWTFLATGKNKEELGQKVFTTLSNVLKTKHDTIKNAINNIR